jgi:hypothetical protein
MCWIAQSVSDLRLDTWKKLKVEGVEVTPLRVVCANLPKSAQMGATFEGHR